MVGLEKLLIPVKESDLTLEKIVQYLPAIMSTFQANANKIADNYEEYKGEHSAVLNKVRQYEDETVNNQVIMQNLWAMVNFKCGYEFGKPISFSAKSDNNAEMEVFNRYMTSVEFNKIMNNVAEWIFAGGVGYTFTLPAKSPDLNYYAPFESYYLRADRCAKVYSSYLAEKPLFDLIVTPISKLVNKDLIDYYILSVYTKDAYYEFEFNTTLNSLNSEPIRQETRGAYSMLPLVEFCAYADKISIVESCKSSQDALDNLISCGVDNVEETANQLLIFRNCSLGETEEDKRETLANAKKFGALEIFDNGKDIEAEVKTLTTIINHSDTNVLINYILGQMYGNWGVPLASSSVSSGNITQAGGEVANGWQNAFSVAQKELSNILPSIKQLLSQYFAICKQIGDCPIQTLNENDMEIKPTIARSENLLTKTQAFTNLVEHNVPYATAWETCELSGDANAIGSAIDEREKYINSQKADNIGASESQQKITQNI